MTGPEGIWGAGALVGIGCAVLAAGLWTQVSGARRELARALGAVAGGGPGERTPGLRERAFRPLWEHWARQWGRLMPQNIRTGMATALTQAGRRADRADLVLLGRGLGAVAGGVGGVLVGVVAHLPLGAVGFLGVFGLLVVALVPSMELTAATERRRARVRKVLPDTLDLLVTTVEAGLGFEASLTRVVDGRSDPLSEEIRLALTRMRYGQTRGEALRDIGRRTGVEDVQRFAQAVAQADEMGSSIGGVLRAQSQLLRRLRILRTEEEAARIPVKMLFPMVMFILPGLFLMILGPAVLRALSLGIFR